MPDGTVIRRVMDEVTSTLRKPGFSKPGWAKTALDPLVRDLAGEQRESLFARMNFMRKEARVLGLEISNGAIANAVGGKLGHFTVSEMESAITYVQDLVAGHRAAGYGTAGSFA